MATEYQRWRGHTMAGWSPVACASRPASVSAASSAGRYDCAGLRAATTSPRDRSARASRHATQVLPTSVPVPVTSDEALRPRGPPDRRQAASAATSRSTWSSVWAADSVTRSREVPGGDGRRPDGRHQQARARAARPRRPGRWPRRRARPGRSATGGRARTRSTWRAEPADAARRPRRRGRTPQRGQGRGGVGRRGGGGEDEGPGPVAPAGRRRPAGRPRSRRASPSAFDSVPTRSSGTSPSTVGPRGRARRGPRRAPAARRGVRTARPGPSTSATSPSMEKTVSVTTSARAVARRPAAWPGASRSAWR